MKFHPLADLVTTSTRSLLSRSWVHEALRRSLYLSICVMLTGTVAAMGAGGSGAGGSGTGSSGTGGAGGGGGGAAVESYLPRLEVGESVFKVYNQGVALMRAKNFVAAQVKFEQAIRDNPNFAEAHNNLGFTLRQEGPQNYSKALEHYDKAIQLKPTMAEAYENRGVLFAKMGRKTAAEKDLVTLKKLNPKLAGELEQFLKTGREENKYGPVSVKRKS
jgi:tetratricopeptide (TPR) repeat protein